MSAGIDTPSRSSPTCRTSAGASGSSLEEAQSWAKLATDAEQVTVHADVTIALPLLVSALATSARETLAARKPLRFDIAGPIMAVEDKPFPESRFEARE